MEKVTDYLMEQTQRNTAQLFDLMKGSVTAWVETLNWAQTEVQQVTSNLTQQGKEQFFTQLEKIQLQQAQAQKDLQEQFNHLVNLFRQEAK